MSVKRPRTFKNEHRGAWGDVEWYATLANGDADDFYSQENTLRDVTAVEPRASITVNEGICFYGWFSNVRDCTLQVQDVSQACTNNGVFNDRLVMMNGVGAATNGDSGGGFSFGTTAFGSLKGLCGPNFGNRLTFSVADLYDEAIGVRVWNP